MEDRVARLEERVDALTRSVASLERALRRQEGARAASESVLSELEASQSVDASKGEELTPLAGRTFLVLGGAFLLRSLVENEVLAPGLGVIVGLLYAVVWHALAARDAVVGRRTSAVFHGFATAMIGYPLIWEGTVRYGALSPESGAVVLALFGAIGFGVSAWRHFLGYAALTVFATAATALVLMFQSGASVPYVIVLLLLAFATLVPGYREHWDRLLWLAAVPLYLAMAAVAILGINESVAAHMPPTIAAGFLCVALVGHALALGGRALATGDVGGFAWAHTAILTGLFCAGVALLSDEGLPASLIGGVAMPLALAGYATAVVARARLTSHARSVAYLSTTGLIFLLVGAWGLFSGTTAAMVLAGLAVAAAWLAPRLNTRALRAHAIVLAGAAGVLSGLFPAARDLWIGDPGGPWTELTVAAWLAVGSLALVYLAALTHPATADEEASPYTRLVLLALAAVGVAAGIVALLAGPIAAAPGDLAEPGRLATLRTVVLSLAAIGLGFGSARGARPEMAWLARALILAGGGKLLLEDLGVSTAGTLVPAMLAYGLALILVPRTTGSGGGLAAALDPGEEWHDLVEDPEDDKGRGEDDRGDHEPLPVPDVGEVAGEAAEGLGHELAADDDVPPHEEHLDQ